MRELFLMVLLTTMSASASAEWVKLGSFEQYTLYAQPDTINKTGNIVNMFHLYDLNKIDELSGKEFRSVVSKASYNCRNVESRMLSANAYAGNMAKNVETLRGAKIINRRGGRKISTISEPGKWKPIMSGSAEELLLKFACEGVRK